MDEMTLVEAVDRLKKLGRECYRGQALALYEDGLAIEKLLRELELLAKPGSRCPKCNGTGHVLSSDSRLHRCIECCGSGKR